MWKEYSKAYLKNNRSTGVSIMIGAFISALLLSLLCGLFYNAWKYEVERIRAEEGGWHSRLTGEIDGGDLELIRGFSNVEKAVINEEASQGGKTAVELYFFNMAGTVRDTEHIAALAGLSPEAAEYHHSLLAMYLVRDTKDTAPRLVFPVFILITLLASVSLAVMVHNLFAVSMNDRIHQFGIFSSIGATPGQIRTCLLQEAASLCAVPVIAGNGNFKAGGCTAGKQRAGAEGDSVRVSSARSGRDVGRYGPDYLDIRADTGGEAEPDDAAGGHQEYGRGKAEKKKAFAGAGCAV